MFNVEREDNRDVVYRDLLVMGALLNDSGMCPDISPLMRASEYCRNESTAEFWCYPLEKLAFNKGYIYAPGGTIPNGVRDITIEINVIAKGKYIDNTLIQNPLIEVSEDEPYSFDLELAGSSEDNGELFCSWHFDKSIKSKPTKFLHPEFHWTFGGKKMEERSPRIGNTFIMPAPRISHPPFDAILAIDYVIKHYIEKEMCMPLLDESEYITIVQRSQTRLWRPYALSFAAHWISYEGLSFSEDFSAKRIFPELF